MKSYRKSGFTLIELLVVIAIIAILAAILFPVFAQAKLAAKKAVDLSNLKQIGTAIPIYTNDYDDIYPLCSGFQRTPGWQYGNMTRWSSQLVLGPYIKNTGIFQSPVDSPYKPDYTIAGGYWSWAAPIPSTRDAEPLSYMVNAMSNNTVGAAPSPYFPPTVTDYTGPFDPGGWFDPSDSSGNITYHTVSVTAASDPASLITLTNGQEDSAKWWAGTQLATLYTTETFPYYGGDLMFGWDAVNLANGTYFGGADPNLNRAWRKYNNASNFSFSDSHAKNMQPGSLLLGPLVLNPKYWLVNSDGF